MHPRELGEPRFEGAPDPEVPFASQEVEEAFVLVHPCQHAPSDVRFVREYDLAIINPTSWLTKRGVSLLVTPPLTARATQLTGEKLQEAKRVYDAILEEARSHFVSAYHLLGIKCQPATEAKRLALAAATLASRRGITTELVLYSPRATNNGDYTAPAHAGVANVPREDQPGASLGGDA